MSILLLPVTLGFACQRDDKGKDALFKYLYFFEREKYWGVQNKEENKDALV